MKRTIFILGRTPKLAFLELQSLYPDITLLSSDVAIVSEKRHVGEVIDRLGGTVKIANELKTVSRINPTILFDALFPFVREGKMVFGLSGYGSTHIPSSYASVIKQLFVERHVIVRYVESKHNEALTSVVVSKQHVVELVVIGLNDTYLLGVTGAVQNFEDWNTRDSARPEPDPHRGMLPPKVARMIVNIAISNMRSPVVLDPFCGVGTVVGEALLSHARAIGIDISHDAVVKAQKNIDWLRAHYGLLQKDAPHILLGDATHVSELLAPDSVDAIVTEPFMGKQASGIPIKNIIRGLEKMYLGCFKDWAKILKSGGRIVMATPAYVTDRGISTVKKVVDRCEILGYTLVAGPIEYSRPKAMVRREFYVFIKK